MRGMPDYDPEPDRPPQYDVRGVALRLNDRICYCGCGDVGLTVAWVVQLAPEIVVFEADARRYVRIFDSRQLVIVEAAAVEREVWKALQGIGS